MNRIVQGPRRATLVAAAAVSLTLASAQANDAARPLRYVDGSFGLAIELPQGSVISRIKRPAGQSGTEIMQFTLPDGNTVGRIVVSELPADVRFDTAVQQLTKQLAQDINTQPQNIHIAKVQVRGHYQDAKLISSWNEANRVHNSVLVVQGPARQLFVLYAVTRKVKQQEARQRIRKLIETFTVLLQDDDERRLQAALETGLQCLLSVAAPIPKPEQLWQEQYLLIQRKQEPVGFFVIWEKADQVRGKKGLTAKWEKWLFWPKGRAEYELQTAFVTWDLHEEEWFYYTETVAQNPGAQPRLQKASQKILRLGRTLLVQAPSLKNPRKPIERIVECPRAFLPLAWRWLFPRLLQQRGVTPDSTGSDGWIAAVTYSPLRRGLETQMLSREAYGSVRRILHREGLYGATQTWQFDLSGRLRYVDSADWRLIPTSKDEATRLFGARIASWRKKFKAEPQ